MSQTHALVSTAAQVPAPVKKSRKPALTRARPSTDALTQPVPIREASQAPSDTRSRASSPRQRSMSRSLSARPEQWDRSQSVETTSKPSERAQMSQSKKGMMRAPSGKDLFKGRQVGLMRRTTSVVAKKPRVESQGSLGFGRSESQAKVVGLLGRKVSDPNRRNSGKLPPYLRQIDEWPLTLREPISKSKRDSHLRHSVQAQDCRVDIRPQTVSICGANTDTRGTIKQRAAIIYHRDTSHAWPHSTQHVRKRSVE